MEERSTIRPSGNSNLCQVRFTWPVIMPEKDRSRRAGAGFGAWQVNYGSDAEVRKPPAGRSRSTTWRALLPTARCFDRYLYPDPSVGRHSFGVAGSRLAAPLRARPRTPLRPVPVRRSVNSSGSYIHSNRTVTTCQVPARPNLEIRLIEGERRLVAGRAPAVPACIFAQTDAI
jgi:hypothetical protein